MIRLHAATAGSVGLAADAVATGWDGDDDRLPAGLVDAVNARIRRAGPDAAAGRELGRVITPGSFAAYLVRMALDRLEHDGD